MGRIYTFAFDSTLNAGGTSNNKRSYVTNWSSVLPENTAFKVTFSFMTAQSNIVNTPTIMTLQMDLGQSSAFQGSGNSFSSTRFLGTILFAGTSLNSYYYSEYTTNPPIYINARPQSAITEVCLHQGLTLVNYNTPVPSDYILMLSFEEC